MAHSECTQRRLQYREGPEMLCSSQDTQLQVTGITRDTAPASMLPSSCLAAPLAPGRDVPPGPGLLLLSPCLAAPPAPA